MAASALTFHLAVTLVLAVCASAQITQQLTSPQLSEQKQRALFAANGQNPYLLGVNTLAAPAKVDNAAIRTLKADRDSFPFLSTLPNAGSAVYITALKPCGLVLPHIHPRATEQYLVISGTMTTGLAEENGARQNTTAEVGPGQSFVAPQGLLHYNANKKCSPLVFVQIFDSSDPGSLTVGNALAALSAVDPSSISASLFANVTASPLSNAALDQNCLAQCGLTSAGGSLNNLSADLQAFIGLTGAQAPAPSTTSGR